MSKHSAGDGAGTQPGQAARPRRKRVILADSAAPVTLLRTVDELEEQTSWAEEVVSEFIRAQIRSAVLLACLAIGVLGVLPALFFLIPGLSQVSVAGMALPWLLLGILPFPLLFGIGYWYNVLAEEHEKAFVGMVEK
ncbi:hypothetical protein ACFPM7_00150 [Actinokineospora guangxiensis]|uniref:DUF485 domain-containing protein n=1 Tax=Actinokineospora guangxiensis TaxID=1490288 RepID=A0ABW0EDH2_9PSEU